MMRLIGQFGSKRDKTIKYVFENENNEIIEISLICNKKQDIIYVPTHYNCPLGCLNCTLTPLEKSAELKPIKFHDLMEAIENTILPGDVRASTNTKILLSFRGVGEPLLNMPLLERVYKEKYNLEKYGYNKVGFEISTMMPDTNLNLLASFIKEGKYPLRVIFRLSSPCDDKRRILEPQTALSVDSSLTYLKIFKDEINNNAETKKRYRDFFGSTQPVEIRYSITSDVNDSAFELANLQYFGSRFQIPIVFLKNKNGEELWIEDILSHYPDAKLSVARVTGKDLGCEHGHFMPYYYSDNHDEQDEEYMDWYAKHHLNEDQTIKKVLYNKVV